MIKYLRDICKDCSLPEIDNFDGLSIGQLEKVLHKIKRTYGNVIIRQRGNGCIAEEMEIDFGDRKE